MRTLFCSLLFLLVLMGCSGSMTSEMNSKPLAGVRITIDPGHGNTEAYDDFRIGPSGEREEWINLRVAKRLARKLTHAGADVFLTRTSDKDVSLGGRAALAKRHQSDLLVSIHHNGSGSDPNMDLPIVYFFGQASLNPASVDFANILFDEMRKGLEFEQPDAGAVYSDHLIYDSGTSVLRNTVEAMPGVIGEGGFFTNLRGEARLKSRSYNEREAEVYFQAILSYFDQGIPSAQIMLPDSLEYIDLQLPVQFKLNDGFGSTFFQEDSFKVLQDGEVLKSTWDAQQGILSCQPLPSQEHRIVFQVYGRNFKGNAIHPKPFRLITPEGFDYYTEETWKDAFEKALQVQRSLSELADHELLAAIDEALRLYSLSLDIQIVHPKARQAEDAILDLLITKSKLVDIDMGAEIRAQAQRIREFYPDQRTRGKL